MEKILEIGKHVRINVFGTIYDGTVTEVTDEYVKLEENCGSSTLVKVLFRNNIAAIERRIM